jgi:hypothetical protein
MKHTGYMNCMCYKECKVCRNKVRTRRHADRQLGSEVMLSLWNGRQEVRARCSTARSIRFPSGICYQRFIQGCEGAEELSRQSWQVVYHQLQRSCSSALEFIRNNSGGDDGGTPTALVGYPVQRVFRRILTIAPKTTLVFY